MKLVIRLLANQRCGGCGGIVDVEEKTLLCLYCFALKLAVERRRTKLQETLRGRFAAIGEKVRQQMEEFRRM